MRFLPRVTFLLAIVLTTIARGGDISYQGELRRNGNLFTGTAQMKFAICKNGQTVWSNDQTSTACVQPIASVNVTAAQGIFTVILGGPGMQTVAGPGVNDLGGAVLRVWANTGSGFGRMCRADRWSFGANTNNMECIQ